jgi:hypothetical protein
MVSLNTPQLLPSTHDRATGQPAGSIDSNGYRVGVPGGAVMAVVGHWPTSRSLSMISTGRLHRDQVFEVVRADGAAQSADDVGGVVAWALDEEGLAVATEGDGALD